MESTEAPWNERKILNTETWFIFQLDARENNTVSLVLLSVTECYWDLVNNDIQYRQEIFI